MKIESRGKYPGVKIHLEEEECLPFLKLWDDHQKAGGTAPVKIPTYFDLAVKLGRKIKNLLDENPNLFKERTEEEVHATLSKELIESQEKLAAIGKGADWKKVKVETIK